MSDDDLTFDSVQSWLNANPSAHDEAPDLVAMAQRLARELESADTKDVAGLVREYRLVRAAIEGVIDGGEDEDNLGSALSSPVRDGKKS